MRALDRGLILLVALLWGMNFVAGKSALTSLTVWEFRAGTFGLAAVILGAIALVRGIPLRIPNRAKFAQLLLAGALGIGGFGVFSALALLNTTAGRTTIFVYTMPIWVVLLARIVLGERLTGARIGSLVLGIVGLAVLAWPMLRTGEWAGPLAALAAALSWATGTVILKRAAIDAPPIATTAWQLVAGACVSLVGLAVAWRTEPLEWTTVGILGAAYSLAFGTIAAYLIWFGLLQRIPASAAGIGTLLVPVFGVLVSFIVLGEVPTAADLVGLVCISAAALIPILRPERA